MESATLDAANSRNQKNPYVTSVKRTFVTRCFLQGDEVSSGFKLISNISWLWKDFYSVNHWFWPKVADCESSSWAFGTCQISYSKKMSVPLHMIVRLWLHSTLWEIRRNFTSIEKWINWVLVHLTILKSNSLNIISCFCCSLLWIIFTKQMCLYCSYICCVCPFSDSYWDEFTYCYWWHVSFMSPLSCSTSFKF